MGKGISLLLAISVCPPETRIWTRLQALSRAGFSCIWMKLLNKACYSPVLTIPGTALIIDTGDIIPTKL